MLGNYSGLLVFFLIFGYTFLYLPLLIVVFFSFNFSRLVSVWGGFSLKWYSKLFYNNQLLGAAFLSLKIAFIVAWASVIMGVMLAFILVRMGRFKSRSLLQFLVASPVVMPDIISGLSFFLLFENIDYLLGIRFDGINRIILGHTTIGMTYVSAVVRSRLLDMDESVEEAALDLGASPLTVFMVITLPIILPSLAVGWLLAFAISFDDVVVASFLQGPGSLTLPMLVFSNIRQGVNPEINALAAIMVFILSIGVSLAAWVVYKRSLQNA